MNDFQGLLSGDYGFKPQGKSAPMAPPRSNPNTSNPTFDFDLGASTTKKPPYSSKSPATGVFLDDQDDIFSRPSYSTASKKNSDFGNLGGLDDVYGRGSKSPANSSVKLDSVFGGPGDSGSRFSSLPVFDKPVYDDDAFDDVPGLKNSSSAKYPDVFSSSSPPPSKKHDAFVDLLGGFARKEPESKGLGGSGRRNENDLPSFDDLLPGFGRSRSPSDRNPVESSWDKRSTVNGSAKATSDMEDPFVVLNSSSSEAPPSQGFFSDPLEQFSELGGSSRKKPEHVSASGVYFDDIDPLVSLGKSVPMNDREKVGSPARTRTTSNSGQTSANVEASDKSTSVRSPAIGSEKKMAADDYYEPPNFDTFSASEDSHRAAPNTSSSSFVNASDETTSKRHTSNVYESNLDSSDDVWLTVSEIPLFTQPTAAPPPSRPPPPKPPRKAGAVSNPPLYAKKKVDDHPSFPNSAQSFQSPKSVPAGGNSSFSSPIDELADFAQGRTWNDSDGNSDVLSGDDLGRDSEAAVSAAAASAAAMKDAMDRAEAKFKHAKEVRERENAKAARMHQEREDKTFPDFQEREFRDLQERQERECQRREEEERKQREEEERVRREREDREREQRRIERERIEREHARQAVERATREARERAAADARARAEKAAVGKVQAEARERAERAAVMKAQAAARERAARAAFEAKQRADREKAEREAREKSEREAKEKEAREKAAAAAASARANQQKAENDLESFFGMGSRANSAPRTRTSSSDPFSDSQIPKKQSESVRTSVGSTPNIRKTSSSANIVDDLSSIFGGAPSAGGFQEVEGETEERRRARIDRHQRTQERAMKALAEKNKRDLDAQMEQAERHRISETLDVEIRRWAAGKEGNLRALLSTLQYVLWPECGWNPVSLTDLITGAAVKKVYRKATLCIHPDKVQQKGATIQQKYIAEKVFDLLKEAWNKFNSEELF